MLSDICVYVVVNRYPFRIERVFAYEKDAYSFIQDNPEYKIVKQKLWYTYDDIGEENNFFRREDSESYDDDSYSSDINYNERDNFSLKDF